MLMAIYRHFAVVHPINSRKYLNPLCMLAAILITLLFWVLLLLPLALSWETTKINCPAQDDVIMLSQGTFLQEAMLQKALTYTWAIIGFVIPICILAYCNIHLILFVRAANRTSGRAPSGGRAGNNHRYNAQIRMNITLIALVLAYFLFGAPGNLLDEKSILLFIITLWHLSLIVRIISFQIFMGAQWKPQKHVGWHLQIKQQQICEGGIKHRGTSLSKYKIYIWNVWMWFQKM